MLWNASYETGVPLMDTQHQELFRQMDLLSDRNNKTRVPQILEFLGDYVHKHFGDEEHIHAKSGYPHRLAHKKMHSDFVGTYKQLHKEYLDKPEQQGLLLLKINRIALEWLRKHILGPDKQFALYYNDKLGKPTPGKRPDGAERAPSAAASARPAPPGNEDAATRPFSRKDTDAKALTGGGTADKAAGVTGSVTGGMTGGLSGGAKPRETPLGRTAQEPSSPRRAGDSTGSPARSPVGNPARSPAGGPVGDKPARGLSPTDEAVLKRVPAQALADELVRRSRELRGGAYAGPRA